MALQAKLQLMKRRLFIAMKYWFGVVV